MAQDLGDPIEESPKRNTPLIIAIVVIVLLCCCCAGLIATYYGIEPAMELLGMDIPW